MRHPVPPRPPACRPPHREGVLLPTIACCEKRVIPRLCTQLHVSGLPACACHPLRIVRLDPSPLPPTWTAGTPDGCGRVPVTLCIPVQVCVCDAHGMHHSASAVVEADTHLPCSMVNAWQQRLLILPCIRLLDGGCNCCECSFEVQLQLAIDFYLLCFQPCQLRSSAPPCPDLPLYPQPSPYLSQTGLCR